MTTHDNEEVLAAFWEYLQTVRIVEISIVPAARTHPLRICGRLAHTGDRCLKCVEELRYRDAPLPFIPQLLPSKYAVDRQIATKQIVGKKK
jgi:hypothetical protein